MSMMGELSFFLGLQDKQSKEGIFICQSKYCKDILKKFEMEACKAATTPMSTNCYLEADEAGPEVNQTMYRGLIGYLLYLTARRPDIMFVVCLCARFQSCPKESHLKATKRILKYLKGTISMGLWYPSLSLLYIWQVFLIWTLQVANQIGGVQVEHATCLDQASFHGIVRSKRVQLYPLLKLNTQPLVAAMHRFYGSNNSLKILD